jgi:RecJ-like exonuclease
MDCRDVAVRKEKWYTLDEKNMVFTINKDEEEIKIPARYEVCSVCEGKGSHVNPSVDSNGITADEWYREWNHESREDYLGGLYDVECFECKGKRVVPVPNRDYTNPNDLYIWDKLEEDSYNSAYEEINEMKYGY